MAAEELTTEERITRLEATLYKLEEAFLKNPGFFPPDVIQGIALSEIELVSTNEVNNE